MMKQTMYALASIALFLQTPLFSEMSTFDASSQEVSSFANSSASINWLSNYDDAIASSKKLSRPIVVLFTGTRWCPACIKLERDVLSQPEFASSVGNKFVFLKAEFSDHSSTGMMRSPYQPLMDRYHVDSFPTIIIINADGQQLFTVEYRNAGPQEYADEMIRKLH